MGKRRIIAETGAGQHGVATAAICAKLGLDCIVYMGEIDMRRQALNVFRMRLMGAEVRPVTSGSQTLKEAINEKKIARICWCEDIGCADVIKDASGGEIRGYRIDMEEVPRGSCIACGREASKVVYVARAY